MDVEERILIWIAFGGLDGSEKLKAPNFCSVSKNIFMKG